MKYLSGIWIAALILIMAGCDDDSKSPSDNGMPTNCPTTCINGCNPDGSCKDGKAECPVTCTNGCNPDGSCKDSKAECPVTCTNGCNQDGSCKDGKAECPDTCTDGCNQDGSCKDGKAECPTTCTNGCNPDGSCKTNETESCPASCEYGCNQNNECIDISHAKSGDYCSRPFSTCIDNSVYECAANNTLYIDDCNIVNAECRVENVVCNEGECADDDYIHTDIRAFCKDMCASGYKGNSCKDDIQKGDECSGAGSFCKDNNLYLCESSKYKVIDCGAMHLKCVDKDEYWSYCLDLCTKKEYETHAKKIQCVTNYYDSSFNRSYDSPDNAPYYLELFCQKHLSLEGVYHWDWEDSFSGQMCPGVCDKKTDTCKKYPDLGKSCSTEESDPKYYASKCDENILLYCDTDGTVHSDHCEVCADYNGSTGCYPSCDPKTDKDNTSCYRHNEGMNYETDDETVKRCVAVGDKHILLQETRYCETMCDKKTNRCEEPPVYHIDDPCNPDEFWIRCQDETHRFVCTDDKIASEECPSEQKCKNNIYYGGYSNSTCVNESDL